MTIGYDINSSQGRQIATQDIINQLRAKLPRKFGYKPRPYKRFHPLVTHKLLFALL